MTQAVELKTALVNLQYEYALGLLDTMTQDEFKEYLSTEGLQETIFGSSTRTEMISILKGELNYQQALGFGWRMNLEASSHNAYFIFEQHKTEILERLRSSPYEAGVTLNFPVLPNGSLAQTDLDIGTEILGNVCFTRVA